MPRFLERLSVNHIFTRQTFQVNDLVEPVL